MDNAHKINNNRTNDKLFLGKKLNLAVGIRPICLAIAIRLMERKDQLTAWNNQANRRN